MRDDEKITVNIVSEGERELILLTPAGERETYHLNPIRTMRLIASELQIMCGAESHTFDAPERLPSPQFRVQGEAWLEKGHISVIGEPSNKSRAVDITFRAYDEADISNREKKLGRLPPLVHVGFIRRDWEIGFDDSWFVAAYVSQQMLDSIISAISAGTLREMSLGLDLEGIYTDNDWAPPSMSADWFLRPSRTDNSLKNPEMARGYVSVINLCLSKIDLRSKPETEAENEDGNDVASSAVPEPDLKHLALLALNSNIEKFQGTVKAIGWAIALLLLVEVLK
ncbi:hypothetical protein [Pseudoduganella sp. HUAS MS19]